MLCLKRLAFNDSGEGIIFIDKLEVRMDALRPLLYKKLSTL